MLFICRIHLRHFMSMDLRPAGSEANDIKSMEYIAEEAKRLAEAADSNINVEVDIQLSSVSLALVTVYIFLLS